MRLRNHISKSLSGTCILVLVWICMIACIENPDKPVLSSELINTSGNVVLKTSIISDGGSPIIQRGICASTHPNPTLADDRSNEGSGKSSFESQLSSFVGQTKYYVRPYALNGAGVGYGNELSVSFAKAEIENFGDITGNSAFFRAYVITEDQVLSRGICWGTAINPTIIDNKTTVGTGSGTFTSMVTGLTPNTSYHARAYAATASNVSYGMDVAFTTKNYANVTTTEITNAGTFLITVTWTVVNSGSLLISNGVCWSINPNPTIADSKIETTNFKAEPTGLQPGITYHIRAYASDIVGLVYGNEKTITMPTAAVLDADGHPYSSVTLGTQIWTVENLRTTKYASGDPITNVIDAAAWRNTTTEAWSYYENDSQYEYPYGKVYNWYAVTDSRNLCPAGWHVPSDQEWTTLVGFLGGSSVAGGKLKEPGENHWAGPNVVSSSNSGFLALPAGGKSTTYSGYGFHDSSWFWSSTAVNAGEAYNYYMFFHDTEIRQYVNPKGTGFSVRCLKD